MSGFLAILLGVTLLSLAACTGKNPAFRVVPVADAAGSEGPAASGPDAAPGADRGTQGLDTPVEMQGPQDAAVDEPAVPDRAPDAGETGDLADEMDLAQAPDLVVDSAPPAPPQANVATGTVGVRHGGTEGNAPVTSECRADEALIGYHGADEVGADYRLVGTLQAVCGQLSLTSGEPGTPVQTTGMRLLTRHGRTAIMWMEICPAGQVVVSVAGRSEDYLDNLQIGCAPLTVSSDRRTLTLGSTTLRTAHGGPLGDPFSDPCPIGRIAHGSVLSSGFWIDSLQLICSTVTLAP